MGTLIGMFFIGIPVLLLIAAFMALFLWLGTSVAGVDNRSYGKAFIATGIDFFATWILNFVLGLAGVNGGIIAFGLGVALAVVIIQRVFATTWPKAIVAYIIQLVAIVVLIGVPAFFLVGAAALSGLGA